MTPKVKCYGCGEILGVDRTIFDGHYYCDDKCAVPDDTDKSEPIKYAIFDKFEATRGNSSRRHADDFLDDFYRAIEGGSGQAYWGR